VPGNSRPLSGRLGDGLRLRRGAHSGRRRKHPAEHRRQPGSGSGPGGQRHSLGSENPDTMFAAADLAQAYISQVKFAKSEPLAREALEFRRKMQADSPGRFYATSLLGASLAGQKNYADPSRCCSRAFKGCWLGKTGFRSRAIANGAKPDNGSSVYIGITRGNRSKPPSGVPVIDNNVRKARCGWPFAARQQ
jgi:hypothetical protein